MWNFEYFGCHYGAQKLSCSKLWHLSFQTPYYTCHYEAWMKFGILVKIEDFFINFNEKWHFSKFDEIPKNHEHWMGSKFWSRMTIQTIDTALESSGFIFFEKMFLGTTGVPRSVVMSHLCAPLMNWFQWSAQMEHHNWTWYSSGTQKHFFEK